MAKKRQIVSKKTIQKLLADCVFDPREQLTPFSIIVGMNDPAYYESKALELIMEAKSVTNQVAVYHEKIVQAISLLTLARSFREPLPAAEDKKDGSGSKDTTRPDRLPENP